MDNLTKVQRHKNMKNIKSSDTKIESTLRRSLWNKGIHYRKNYKVLPGKPDIVLTKYKIAIFCDGEFFHGFNWTIQSEKLKKSNNNEYWLKKISKNMERDFEVDKELTSLGWIVVHFWGKYILKHTDECVRYIEELIYEYEITNNYKDDFDFKDYFN